jgi:hypothetical protein
METTNAILITISIILIGIMFFFVYKSDKVTNECSKNHHELSMKIREEIEKLSNETRIYMEYVHLFKIYCNEDWSRESPFCLKIDVLSDVYFSRGGNNIIPLKTLIRDVNLREKEKNLDNLKNIFKEDFEIIQNMYLGQLLLFIADLKSYDGISHPEKYCTPETYYKWRLECYNNSNKNNIR